MWGRHTYTLTFNASYELAQKKFILTLISRSALNVLFSEIFIK